MRALLFDLDNTLIDRDSALQAALLSEFKNRKTVSELMRLDNHGYGSRSGFLEHWSQLSGVEKSMTCLSKAICAQLQPDAALLAALNQLKSRYSVGVITNGGVDNQKAKLHKAGFQRVFESRHILISGGLAFAKPAREIFELACDVLQVPVEHALYIGDHPLIDVQAARKAGLKALLAKQVLTAATVAQLPRLLHANS